MENEIMLVNERYHMLEEVSDDIVLDYDVKKQQFEDTGMLSEIRRG